MNMLVLDPGVEAQLIEDRKSRGIDRHDEVWDGVYIIFSPKENLHQEIRGKLTNVFQSVMGWSGDAEVRLGVNLSDRKDNWTQNYRCPDVAVFLADTKAENFNTFWYGGPDFAVDIISPGDRSREKLEFYARIGTRELLIVDRDPWQLELYRLEAGQLRPAAISTLQHGASIESQVLPFSFRLADQQPRPVIDIAHSESDKTWRV